MTARSPDAEPPRPSGPERTAGRIAAVGVGVFPLLSWGFAVRLDVPLPDAVYLAGLLGLLPFLAVAQLPLVAGAEIERMEAYAGTAGMLVVLGGGALFLGWKQPGLAGMGLGRPDPTSFLIWTGSLLATAVLLQLVFLGVTRFTSLSESRILRQILPRTGIEKAVFVGVSLVAGFGEELAFRGYAIPALAPVLGGGWAAAAFTSVVFGLVHAYQGVLGIARTGLLGAIFAASFVLSGTLWPAVAAHVAVDVIVGVWLWEKMLGADAGARRGD